MEVVGQIYKHFDEAGLLTMNEYDFKGNVLQKTREVISDSEILAVFNSGSVSSVDCYRVDWGASPQMEGNYKTSIEYDALNRVMKMKYPEDTDQERKELTPTYNRAGALESVVFDGDTYVDHIAYNARGQRLMIALGNDVMTRYAYDDKTFRLSRICSEKYQKTGWLYSPDGGVKQDTAYNYDLTGNIISTNDASPNSGVGDSDSLEREFSYDPLYRLLSATGRENAPTISPIWDDRYRSDDHTQTTDYTQKYNYDKMGNILRLKHTGNSDFTRIFNPDNGNMPDDYGNQNLLNEVKIGSTNYSFQYDANGNLIRENADRFYEWDAADQMRCFFIDDGSTITKHAHYLYDAAGNRVKKLVRVDGGNYTSNTYIDGVFERKTDGTDEQNTLHIMDDTSRILLIRLGDTMGDSTPSVKYTIENHIFSSVLELKADGQNITREEYYPFGETSFGSHAFKRYKYNGKERDHESGMYYYGARYYNTWCCRFISVDPLHEKFAHLSSYNYASNSPIGEMDIDGMQNKQEGTSAQAGTEGGVANQGSAIETAGEVILDNEVLGIDPNIVTYKESQQMNQAAKSDTKVSNEKSNNLTSKGDPGSFNLEDAEQALKAIYNKYGAEMAKTVEKMYRLETRHFKSKQYKDTGTAGMEVFGEAPTYGWGGDSLYETNPEYKPIGTTAMFEDKGLSEVGGNVQVTTSEKEFIVFPSVEAGMMYLADYIERHDGNHARWFSTQPSRQETYREHLKGVIPRIVNKIEKTEVK